MLEKLFLGALIVVGVVGLILGIYWLFWLLWAWVMPQVWPTGPDALVRPGYWLFVGMMMCLSIVGGAIFRSGKS